MKRNIVFIHICIISFASIIFSCDSGFTISENDFRGVAAFDIPTLDESTGVNVFTANFNITECTATTLLEEHGSTNHLKISNINDSKTTLTMFLNVDGLVTGDYSNVKVSAEYTSLTATSKNLVEKIQFDRYGEMVFEANTGITSFDPSASTIIIDLNTSQTPQLGYITFTFEFAKSVYDESKSTQFYTLYLNVSNEKTTPFLYFKAVESIDIDNTIEITNFTSNGFTATHTNDLLIPANRISQDVQISLSNVTPDFPLTISLAKSSTEGGVELHQTESTGGTFSFTINYAEEKSKIKVTENTYVFEINDKNNYYQGLNGPLYITVKTVRNYPTNVLPSFSNSFSTSGNASPWSWRMQYSQLEKGNKRVKKDHKTNSGQDVTSPTYEWED